MRSFILIALLSLFNARSWADFSEPFTDSPPGKSVAGNGWLIANPDGKSGFLVLVFTDSGYRVLPATVPAGSDVQSLLGKMTVMTATIHPDRTLEITTIGLPPLMPTLREQVGIGAKARQEKRVGYLTKEPMQHPKISERDDYLDLYDQDGQWRQQIILAFDKGVAGPENRSRPVEMSGLIGHIDLGGPPETKGEYGNEVMIVESWKYLEDGDVSSTKAAAPSLNRDPTPTTVRETGNSIVESKAVEPTVDMVKKELPVITGKITFTRGSFNGYGPPRVGDSLKLDLQALDAIHHKISFDGQQRLSYVALLGPLRAESLRRMPNGSLRSARLVSSPDNDHWRVTIDIQRYGNFTPPRARMWIIGESETINSVAELECELSM